MQSRGREGETYNIGMLGRREDCLSEIRNSFRHELRNGLHSELVGLAVKLAADDEGVVLHLTKKTQSTLLLGSLKSAIREKMGGTLLINTFTLASRVQTKLNSGELGREC